MKVSHPTHPCPDKLTAYLVGRLNAVDSGDIRQHLAACESCCGLLDSLPADDTIVAALRQQDRDTSVSADECADSFVAPTVAPEANVETHAPRSATTEIHGLDADGLKLPLDLRSHDRYRIVKLLGRGGMGDVYQAEHKVMNRQVALKVIKPQLVQNDAAVLRFRREVQAAARLHHPNIVAAYDAEQVGDLHYLVMEFVDGTNLDQVIRQRGALPVEEACEYIRQVAEGLQYAHELGMVHRDVKPHNLMLVNRRDSLPAVKILDFGLANFANDAAAEEAESHGPEYPIEPGDRLHPLTQLGTMMGTPDYIAPEQAVDAHRADIRSDIYSLGCTFYMLLTGQTPFGKGSVDETVKAHTEQAAPPLSDFRDDVTVDVETVLKKMMAKDPVQRFQTPSEVVVALKKRRPQISKPLPQPSPQPILSGRGPRVLAITLLMGFFLAAMAAIVVTTNRGRLEIQSEADDVQVVVRKNGQEVRTIDLTTGSQVTWLPSGKYELELVGNDNDVVLNERGFEMSRLGKVVVTACWSSADHGVIRSYDGSDSPIAKNAIEVVDHRDPASGWKITADQSRTVRLFEVPMPPMKPGRFFYRAKLKTADISGRALLEMWVRVPGSGESFSKGFHNAVSGTNGWAEYEIPFFLREGEQPDLVKLNVTIEGSGTVWIKDVELRGRSVDPLP